MMTRGGIAMFRGMWTVIVVAGFAVVARAEDPPRRTLGSTPIPTQQDLEDQKQFIEAVIDPQNTLDLIEGRPRLILLKATPTRTQIADDGIATFRLLEPEGLQMTIVGRKSGTTVLNLWFADPNAKGKEKVLSYLVRVFPDPEAKERAAAALKVTEGELNAAFPNSRVRLTPVGDKTLLSGQAHDIVDAVMIRRALRR